MEIPYKLVSSLLLSVGCRFLCCGRFVGYSRYSDYDLYISPGYYIGYECPVGYGCPVSCGDRQAYDRYVNNGRCVGVGDRVCLGGYVARYSSRPTRPAYSR